MRLHGLLQLIVAWKTFALKWRRCNKQTWRSSHTSEQAKFLRNRFMALIEVTQSPKKRQKNLGCQNGKRNKETCHWKPFFAIDSLFFWSSNNSHKSKEQLIVEIQHSELTEFYSPLGRSCRSVSVQGRPK